MKGYIPRLGDVVRYKAKNDKKSTVGIVVGTDKMWYCIRGHVEVDQTIMPIGDIKELLFRLPEEIILKLEKKGDNPIK